MSPTRPQKKRRFARSNRGGVWCFLLGSVCTTFAFTLLSIHQELGRQESLGNQIETLDPTILLRGQYAEKVNDKPAEDSKKTTGEVITVRDSKENHIDELDLPERTEKDGKSESEHRWAHLSCKAYGGPSNEFAAEMVYWADIPTDASFVSPYKTDETKYVTYEPDVAGFNNVRMGLETALTMTMAMGRTFVMPPYGLSGLHDNENKKDNLKHFADYFQLESIATENRALDIISFEEFLIREIVSGKIKNETTGELLLPPGNRTDWNGAGREEAKVLNAWSRNSFRTSPWEAEDCMAAFLANPTDRDGERRLKEMVMKVTRISGVERMRNMFRDNPVPVNAPSLYRLAESLAHRKGLCLYDQALQQEKVIHVMGDSQLPGRLFVHFYAFLFFEDWKQDLWTKRFVRDHMRYKDEIQCAAARVVHAVRELSKKNGNGGQFDTLHIRRGDFSSFRQESQLSIGQIYNQTFDVLEANSTIYIATDERNTKFFDLLKIRYNVYLMSDFQDLFKNVDKHYYGMIDQLIASRGRTFVGQYYSTFTGYINRLRGYHSQKEKSNGYELGQLKSFFLVHDIGNGNYRQDLKNLMKHYLPLSPPTWAMEFPLGWRDIDKGLSEMASREGSHGEKGLLAQVIEAGQTENNDVASKMKWKIGVRNQGQYPLLVYWVNDETGKEKAKGVIRKDDGDWSQQAQLGHIFRFYWDLPDGTKKLAQQIKVELGTESIVIKNEA